MTSSDNSAKTISNRAPIPCPMSGPSASRRCRSLPTFAVSSWAAYSYWRSSPRSMQRRRSYSPLCPCLHAQPSSGAGLADAGAAASGAENARCAFPDRLGIWHHRQIRYGNVRTSWLLGSKAAGGRATPARIHQFFARADCSSSPISAAGAKLFRRRRTVDRRRAPGSGHRRRLLANLVLRHTRLRRVPSSGLIHWRIKLSSSRKLDARFHCAANPIEPLPLALKSKSGVFFSGTGTTSALARGGSAPRLPGHPSRAVGL